MKLTKVKGHADDEMVRLEVVRAADKTMVMTVLMLLLSVVVDMFTSTFLTPVSSSLQACHLWCPTTFHLHRFFIAVARTVVNTNDRSGSAPDLVVWSVGSPLSKAP